MPTIEKRCVYDGRMDDLGDNKGPYFALPKSVRGG
jgi:hypothetical protein